MSAFTTLAKLVDEAIDDAAASQRHRIAEAEDFLSQASIKRDLAKAAKKAARRHRKAQSVLRRVAKLLS